MLISRNDRKKGRLVTKVNMEAKVIIVVTGKYGNHGIKDNHRHTGNFGNQKVNSVCNQVTSAIVTAPSFPLRPDRVLASLLILPLLSVNRIQSRVVTGPPPGQNTLYIMGQTDIPLYRKCRPKNGTSAHVLC
jgi:hypothetical protein